MKILGHDGAGISPCAIQGRIGHVIHQRIDPVIGGSGRCLEYGFERKGHVRSRISVRHGKHIDAVQVLAALEHVTDTGRQCAQHARSIKIGYGC